MRRGRERKKTYVADFLAREYQVDREGARTALFGPEPGMDELHRPQMAEGPKPARGTVGRSWGHGEGDARWAGCDLPFVMYVALTVIYFVTGIYSRSVRREKLEKEWDTDPAREGADRAGADGLHRGRDAAYTTRG